MDDGKKTLEKLSTDKLIEMLNCCGYYPYHVSIYKSVVDEIKRRLKPENAVKPYADFDGHDVWRCGNCGATIFHFHNDASDEDEKNFLKFCAHCGRIIKWEK